MPTDGRDDYDRLLPRVGVGVFLGTIGIAVAVDRTFPWLVMEWGEVVIGLAVLAQIFAVAFLPDRITWAIIDWRKRRSRRD